MIINLFLKTKDGADAKAEYDSITKVCVVKKKSKVSSTISTAPTFKSKNSIKKQRDEYVVDSIVFQDVEFKSSSTAANFVTGRSTDGMYAWKDKEGNILKDLLSES